MKGKVEIIVRGVAVVNGRLLVCHSKGAGNTYLPGGHVDFGEDVKSALVREIDEEMGRVASVKRFLGACDHSFIQKGKRHFEVNLVFEMAVDDIACGEEPASQEDNIEFDWINLEQLTSSSLEPSVLRECLPQWIAEECLPDRWASTIE